MLGFLCGMVLGIVIGIAFSDACVGLRKALSDTAERRNEDIGAVVWQDLLVICMAILVVCYGIGFWVVATVENRQDASKDQIIACNKAGLISFADSLNERTEFTNALAARELEQDEALQKALVTLTDPEAPPRHQKRVLVNYLQVTQQVNDLGLKAQSARIKHPLPTVKELADCYKGA